MQDLKGKRIAAYARYSSDRQSAASIPDQLRICREYAERQGGFVDDNLLFIDRAISGASASRPGLQSLLIAVHDGLIDVVLTEDLSRIGRSVGNNDRLLKQLSNAGARLIAINDGFDTGERKARLLGAVKSAMAEDYLDELKERTKRGMDGVFDAGMATGGRAYGYRTVPADDGTVRRRIVIDEAQARVVQRIFRMFAAGQSQKAIAAELNKEGLAAHGATSVGAHLGARHAPQRAVHRLDRLQLPGLEARRRDGQPQLCQAALQRLAPPPGSEPRHCR